MEVGDQVRKQLCALARNTKRRTVGRPPVDKSRWFPTSVIDPATGAPFTEYGAWEYVAILLESGHACEIVVLDSPPGKSGYVVKCEIEPGKQLYIKLRLGTDVVIGRSFHYSEYNRGSRE